MPTSPGASGSASSIRSTISGPQRPSLSKTLCSATCGWAGCWGDDAVNLAVPAALWGLLVLPLIVLLYMLRTRRLDLPVSSLMLWQRARKDLAARRPVRRFERSLLLLLQLLAASLLIFALARPRVHLPGSAEMRT